MAALTPEILTWSVALEGLATEEPVDRMMVLTAVVHGAQLVTADARMLAYPGVAASIMAGSDNGSKLGP